MPKRAALRSTLIFSMLLLASVCTAKAPDATTASAAASVLAASAATPAGAAAAKEAPIPVPVQGVDYELIDSPAPVSGPKVQVVEVFGFGCIHCFHFQPDLASWLKTLPADVQFKYMPGPFGGISEQFAHAFYAAETMGIEAKSHDGIFKEIWVDKRVNVADDTTADTDIPKMYADYGVDPKVFASTMQSFAVSAKVAAARDQEVQWSIQSTPTLVVDGKYRVQMTIAGGPRVMLHTVDWLIAKQRPEHVKH